MTHHFSSFFKSAAGVLGNAANTQNHRQNQIVSANSATAGTLTTIVTRSSYNPLHTTSSTYTNPSENLPPTPNIRAIDEVPDLEIDAPSLFGVSGITNYRGVDTGPVAVPVAVPGMGSLVRQQGMAVGQGIIVGRQRGFTIPRKPLPAREARKREERNDKGEVEHEVRGRALARQEKGHGGDESEIVELRRGEQLEGEQSVAGQESQGGELAEEPEIIESGEERIARLERERMEREAMDLNHENPLRSHPVHATTIAAGTAPTTSSIYTNHSNSPRSRGFRRSYTAPINGFNFAAMGGVDVGPMGTIHGIDGIGTMERGSAAQRYNSNNASGSRTAGFLRRASISWRGLGFGRSSSGGVSAAGVAPIVGTPSFVVERPGTLSPESDGFDQEMLSADAERRRSHRQSLILPKFEWEEEFLGGGNEEDN